MSVLVIVPARQFSQGQPGKNRANLGPTLELVKELSTQWECIVATDDPMVARATDGVVSLYQRPAGDDGPLSELVQRVIRERYAPFTSLQTVVVLQPSSPSRHRFGYIWAAVRTLAANPDATSVVSVVPWVGEPPAKACYLSQDGTLTIPDAPSRRQDCPQAYRRDGTVYAVRAEYARQGDLYGPRPVPLLVTPSDSVTLD